MEVRYTEFCYFGETVFFLKHENLISVLQIVKKKTVPLERRTFH